MLREAVIGTSLIELLTQDQMRMNRLTTAVNAKRAELIADMGRREDENYRAVHYRLLTVWHGHKRQEALWVVLEGKEAASWEYRLSLEQPKPNRARAA